MNYIKNIEQFKLNTANFFKFSKLHKMIYSFRAIVI